MEDTPGSLPAGWTTEIKTKKSGPRAGTQYKCYIDPLTGKKFYSKKEALRVLKSRNGDNRKSEPEEIAVNTPCPEKISRKGDNRKSQPEKKAVNTPCHEKIQSSSDSLPPGWIKEIRVRKNEQGVVYRKDPFYIDPATGHVFRSKVEVFRYLKTGVLGKHSRKQDQRNVSGMQPLDDGITFPFAGKRQKHAVAKRRLSNGSISASDAQMTYGTSRSCSVSHGSIGCSTRRQSERIQAAQLLKKQLLEFEDGNQPSDSKERLTKKQLPESDGKLEDGDQPSDMFQQKLLRKQLPGLEDGSQSLKGKLLKKQPPELQNGNQPSDLSLDQTHCASLENQHYHEPGLPLKLKDKKPLEDVLAMESEDGRLEANGRLSGFDVELSEDVGPSEGKKHRGNQLPFELVHNNPSKHGSSSKSQDKLLEHNLPFKSAGEKKVSDMNLILKGLFRDSEEENQFDTVIKGASSKRPLVDQSLNAKSKSALVDQLLSAKSESLQVDQSLHVKSSPLESEDNKQLHDEMAKPKARSTNIHSCKRKSQKASVLPSRTSKRLAGLEADPALNLENPEHACRQAAKRQAASMHQASPATEECEQGMANDGKQVMAEMKRAAIVEQDGSAAPSSIATEVRQPGMVDEEAVVVEAEKVGASETDKLSADKAEKSMDNDERPESLISPFGDSWPDPCLEFAFKTLTGEISMDTLVIGDYFQQQLGGNQCGNQFSKPSL